MSPPHQSPESPLPPIPPSRPASFGPLSQYHLPPNAIDQHHRQQSQHALHPAATVSPLSAERPDSPTLGHTSPVSIKSPEPIRSNRTALPAPESAQAAAAPARSQKTAHTHERIPSSKVPTTRFPARKPLTTGPTHVAEAEDEDEEEEEAFANPTRPTTLHLADQTRHPAAPAPTTRPQQPNGPSEHGRPASAENGQGLQRIEFADFQLQELELGSAVPGRLGQYGEDQALSGWVRGGKDGGGGVGVGRDVEGVTRGRVRTAEEVGRRNRNWLIGGVFSLVIGVLGAVFIVLYVRNNKPGGAGR